MDDQKTAGDMIGNLRHNTDNVDNMLKLHNFDLFSCIEEDKYAPELLEFMMLNFLGIRDGLDDGLNEAFMQVGYCLTMSLVDLGKNTEDCEQYSYNIEKAIVSMITILLDDGKSRYRYEILDKLNNYIGIRVFTNKENLSKHKLSAEDKMALNKVIAPLMNHDDQLESIGCSILLNSDDAAVRSQALTLLTIIARETSLKCLREAREASLGDDLEEIDTATKDIENKCKVNNELIDAESKNNY